MSTKITTGLVRFSYVHVFEKHAVSEGDEPKYSVSLIIPKSDKKTLAKINAAVDAATKLGVKTKNWGGKKPKNFKHPLRDGEEKEQPEYEDCYFIGCNSKQRPGVVDVDLNPIIDAEEFYSGCYGRASINFFPYDTNSKGVAAGLVGVQKLKDGEPLGGAVFNAEEDFGDGFEFDDDEDFTA